MAVKASISFIEPWEAVVAGLPKVLRPGLTHTADEDLTDLLVWCDDEGVPRGVLRYESPSLLPHTKAGQFAFWVDPECRRKGIATLLLGVADARWKLDFEEQEGYTKAGAAAVNKYLRLRG